MSAWGGPPSTGAWATQVEEEEEENGGELEPVPAPTAAAFPALGGDTAFPALGEAINVKESKRDKKQKRAKNTMSLGAFVAAGKKEPEIVNLPTGPRQRGAEEEERRGGLGGGFKNYGGDRGGGGFDRRDRDDDRGFGDREDEGPSRADAAEDWGTKKAFVPSGPSRGGFSDRDRGSSFGGFSDRDRERGGGFGDKYSERRSGFAEGSLDRADTADKWGSKSFEPSTSSRGGFADRAGFGDRERTGFGDRDGDAGFSKADAEDKWSRRATTDSLDSRGSAGSGTRPRLALQKRSANLPPLEQPPPSAEATAEEGSKSSEPDKPEPVVVPRSGPRANPFGNAKPVDVKEKVQTPPPERNEASPISPSKSEPEKPAAPRPRVNPFGAARPREEVLKEKGITPHPPTAEELRSESNDVTQGVAVELESKAAGGSNDAPPATVSAADKAQLEDSSREDKISDMAGAAASQNTSEDLASSLQTKVVIEHDSAGQAPKVSESESTSESTQAEVPTAASGIASKKAVEQPATEEESEQLPKEAKVALSPQDGTGKKAAEPASQPSASSWAKIAAGPSRTANVDTNANNQTVVT